MPSAGGAVRGPRAQSRSVPHGLCTRHGAAAAAYPPAADHPTRCAHTSRAVLGEERHGGDPPRPRPAGQAPHLKVSGRARKIRTVIRLEDEGSEGYRSGAC